MLISSYNKETDHFKFCLTIFVQCMPFRDMQARSAQCARDLEARCRPLKFLSSPFSLLLFGNHLVKYRRSNRYNMARTIETEKVDNMSHIKPHSWREKPKPFIVTKEGRTETLRCRVNDPIASVVWYKDDDLLQHATRDDIPAYPRHRYVGNKSLGENDLRISSILPADAGTYICESVNPYESKTKIKPLLATSKIIVEPAGALAAIALGSVSLSPRGNKRPTSAPAQTFIAYEDLSILTPETDSHKWGIYTQMIGLLAFIGFFMVIIGVLLYIIPRRRRERQHPNKKQMHTLV